MPLQEIEDILLKYSNQEEKIDKISKQIQQRGKQSEKNSDSKKRSIPKYEQAKERNDDLLKELEAIKGSLRSKAIYSPAEMQWEEICQKYRDEPSLQTLTWRCNIPIFV